MLETEQLEALSPPAEFRIRFLEGPEAGEVFPVEETLSIGTSTRCDVVLTDRAVSRRHCVITPGLAGVAFRDDGSKNGTFLSGVRVRDADLPEGAQVTLGRTTFVVELDESRQVVPAPRPRKSFGRFLGKGRALQSLYDKLEKASASDVTILLEGESGTGKEVLAEAIHEASPRNKGPFVVVDFAAMPSSLIESELFGHERGAFTGADTGRIGAFEDASGGTVFLDEIGELPPEQQTRLLGVLERRSFRRVGGRASIDVDVRVIAATNRNLEREVEEGRFRQDLFYRLAVALVCVPPLRERREDIATLARHFANAFGDPAALEPEVLRRMEAYDWKGNVRELRNYVERLSVFGSATLPDREDTLDPTDRSIVSMAEAAVASTMSYRQARARVVDRFTHAYVEACLDKHDGDVSKAADAAQVARRHFNRLRQR